jgi:hypothetical protein
MRFNSHSRLADSHAFLSPSNYHWVNDTEEKMDLRIATYYAARRGSDLHDLACQLIKLKVNLPDNGTTLSSYVNDCIGFRMTPEQTLRYTDNCYGKTDAIGFNKKNQLRIFDLKTGVNPAKMTQLYVYAAIFCLEYNFKPIDIEMEFRIYQNDDVEIEKGDPLIVTQIMSQIVFYDQRIDQLRMEAYG